MTNTTKVSTTRSDPENKTCTLYICLCLHIAKYQIMHHCYSPDDRCAHKSLSMIVLVCATKPCNMKIMKMLHNQKMTIQN